MAKCVIKNMDIYIDKLENLKADANAMLKEGVYEGAGVVADEVRKSISDLQTSPERWAKKNEKRYINEEQKEGLLNGLGLARIEEDLYSVHTKIGFDGYNAIKTKKYPKGQPNVMIARSTEGGTLFQKKQPFVRTAVNKTKDKAIDKMGTVLDKRIKEKMNYGN